MSKIDEKAKAEGKAIVKSAGKAKKDWHLFCPPHVDMKIKAGDEIKDIPRNLISGLIIEGVLEG